MHQNEIERRAHELFETYRRDLLLNIVKFTFAANAFKQISGEKEIGLYGQVLVSGDSLKAARYRELTGQSLARDACQCCPMVCGSAEEFVQEWREWLGPESIPDLSGGLPVIIFVGSGHHVFHLDLRNESPETLRSLHSEHLGLLRVELQELEQDSDKYLEEMHASGQPFIEQIKNLRQPRLPDEE